MPYYIGTCSECQEENEYYCDGDNAVMCPDCRSIDTMETIESDDP